MRRGSQFSRCGWSLLVLLLLLAGCGGGGGGDAGGGGTPVVYSGNSNAAVISGTNAAKLVVNVIGIGSGDTPAVVSGLSMQGGSSPNSDSKALTGVAPILKRVSRHPLGRTNRTSPARRAISGVAVDQTEPCDGGNGSARTTGTLSDADGTGTLTTTFMNCLLGGNTVNGQATMRVDRVDLSIGEPTDFTISFPRLSVRGPGVSFDIGGSQRTQVNVATNTETNTENSVALDNLTGQMRKTDNLVSVSTYDDIRFPSSSVDTVTGRVYHSVHGFVDVDTPAPLLFATLDQEFPGSGQLLLTGSGNSGIRVTALSATNATLELDLDGNATFEASATLKWTDLSGPVGADLADADTDGMHNSWETFYGLNPGDSADASADNDLADGNNLIEYQNGTNPNVAGM